MNKDIRGMREVAFSSSTTDLTCRRIYNRRSCFEFNHFPTETTYRNESNIDLELLYVGLTNNSSAKKCL